MIRRRRQFPATPNVPTFLIGLWICTSALLMLSSASAQAKLTLASPFSDHAVLQRDMAVPVWGSAEPSAEVAVSFRGQTTTVSADKNGKWSLKLPPLKASDGDDAGEELTATSGEAKVTISDVLVGEVWIGSGQSNMAGGVAGYAKNDPTLFKLIDGPKPPNIHQRVAPSYPRIRLMKGGPKPTWQLADERSIPGFSAILFAYGERLQRELGVPVGLIVGAVGGTPSGAWLSQDAFDKSEACQQAVADALKNHDAEKVQKAHEAKLAAWEKRVAEAEAKGEKPKGRKPAPPSKPGDMTRGGIGNLYERFIRSVVGYGIRGVLWDQGESGTAIVGVDQYTTMGALISGWQREWGQGDFPFIYVQKPSGGGCAFKPGNDNLITREANAYEQPPYNQPKVNGAPQTDFIPNLNDGARRLEFIRIMDYKNAHMVPASDLGSGVHPRNKWGYGNRAAEVTLGQIYGRDYPAHGPRYKSHKIDGAKIRIQFRDTGSGLAFANGEELTGFAIAGDDGKFVWAKATIKGKDSVVVSAKSVKSPTNVRFACSKKRAWANLFSKEGYPALAFTTEK